MTTGAVVIVGATSGIARAIAEELGKQGHPLFLCGRDSAELDRIGADLRLRTGASVWVSEFDSSDPSAVSMLVETATTVAGEVEGVVCAVGYLGEQSKAQDDWAEAAKILETNFVQPANVIHQWAAAFEKKEKGWIVALSSVAGDRGRMSNYVYGSAKGGLTVFLQGLRSRMQKCGVHVMTVKPGPVDTAMTFGMDKLPLLADPHKVGAAIVKALKSRKDVVYVPGPWKLIMFVLRSVPEKIFKKTSL